MTIAFRLNAVAVLTVLLLTAALVPAVADDCTDGVLSCDFTGAEQTDAEAVTLAAVTTTVPLLADTSDPSVRARAFALYGSLLGTAGLPVDAEPRVGLAMRSTVDGTGAETIESTVALYARRGGENGWVVVSRVVTDGADGQRDVGIPAADGDGAFNGTSGATSTADGAPAVSVAFAPGGAGDDRVLSAFTIRDEPTFGTTPVVVGTTPWRITEAARPTVPLADVVGSDPIGIEGLTRLTDPQDGAVTYTVNPDLNLLNAGIPAVFAPGVTLADIVEVAGTAPGQAWSTDALLVTQADNTEDDRGPLPVAVPPLPTDDLPLLPSAVAVAGLDPETGQAGYLGNQHIVVRGTQLWQTNTDTQAHPLVCADRDGTLRPDVCDTDGFNNVGEVLPADGTEDLAPGIYFYVCRIHSGDPSSQSGMWGSFTVAGA